MLCSSLVPPSLHAYRHHSIPVSSHAYSHPNTHLFLPIPLSALLPSDLSLLPSGTPVLPISSHPCAPWYPLSLPWTSMGTPMPPVSPHALWYLPYFPISTGTPKPLISLYPWALCFFPPLSMGTPVPPLSHFAGCLPKSHSASCCPGSPLNHPISPPSSAQGPD